MNLTQLRSLIAIAEAGSVSAAAAAMGITQSGMSQALAALEEDLGIQLLVRTRYGVTLTAFGERALTHAQTALSAVQAIQHDANEAANNDGGSLRIAAFASVFATVMPPLLRRFRSRYPGTELVILETDEQEIESWLEAGIVDVGVVLNPAPEYSAIPLGQDEWVAVLPSTHPQAQQGSLLLAELVSEPFVLATGGCRVHAASLMQ